jgi:hypothetical protein
MTVFDEMSVNLTDPSVTIAGDSVSPNVIFFWCFCLDFGFASFYSGNTAVIRL